MKTTLGLPDALFHEAKAAAVRRRTTFRAIVEQALRRELAPAPTLTNPNREKFEIGPFGILCLKRRPGETVTHEHIKAIQDEMDEEEIQKALHPHAS